MKIHSLSQSVCFTGHRSKKLVQSEEEVKHLLTTAIDDAIAVGYTDFFTGMAEGADIWAAEIVLHAKSKITFCTSFARFLILTLKKDEVMSNSYAIRK